MHAYKIITAFMDSKVIHENSFSVFCRIAAKLFKRNFSWEN